MAARATRKAKEGDAALAYAVVIAETVQEACAKNGRGYVATGHMYLAMSSALNLDQFNAIVGTLVRCGLIERRGHSTSLDTLRWVETPEASARLARLQAAAPQPQGGVS